MSADLVSAPSLLGAAPADRQGGLDRAAASPDGFVVEGAIIWISPGADEGALRSALDDLGS